MRSWFGRMAAFLLCLGTTAAACAGPVDCGPAPSVECLSAEIFSLAKTLPADDGFRRHVGFAERELAPGSIKIALEYVVWDNPHPLPWEDIEWMARAGRFDRATEQAQKRLSPVERLGGSLAVAAQMLDKNDWARAKKIVEDVELQLPSISGRGDDYAYSLHHDTGKLWVRLGQTDRAARLIGGSGIASVDRLLAIASKYLAASSLREQAWQEAERVKELRAWQVLVEDAVGRGDQGEISRAAQRVGDAIDDAIDGNHAENVIPLARALLAAGLPDLSAKLIKPWPQWVNGKEAISQRNTVNDLIPVLAGLARDQDVETAVRAMGSPSDRSESLSKAAQEYFRLGRNDIGEKFDAEALALAESSPTNEPRLQRRHDAALHNLALRRAGRGDIDGALIAALKLRDEAKVRSVLSYVIKRAIDSGYGPVAGPAIETLQQRAGAAQDVGLLLRAAEGWYVTGNTNNARNSLSQALKIVDARQAPLTGNDSGLAAELIWRLDAAGKAESMIGIVDKIGVSDPGAIDHLVKIVRPVSPAVAVQLTGKQVEVVRRITELAEIGIQVAANAK